MSNEIKFYKCNDSHQFITVLHDTGDAISCCDKPVVELKANVNDSAAVEKHVPFVTRNNNEVLVQVGEVPHPMTEEHLITNIIVVQGNKTYTANLSHTDKPEAKFVVEDGPITVYEYCNLHGLWKVEA